MADLNLIKSHQEADDAAMGVLSKTNSMSCISQMPVVLIPIHFDR